MVLKDGLDHRVVVDALGLRSVEHAEGAVGGEEDGGELERVDGRDESDRASEGVEGRAVGEGDIALLDDLAELGGDVEDLKQERDQRREARHGRRRDREARTWSRPMT